MRSLFIKLFSAVLFLATAGCTPTKTEDGESIRLESFQLSNLNGELIDLSEFKGKRVFLNIWATWCGPCIQEMPSILALQEKLNGKVEFLLASDESNEIINKFTSRPPARGLNLVKLDNPENFGINAIPMTFIFDEEGKLIHSEMGARDWASEDSENLVIN
ncbi:MAG: TlpA family protein disulfide reductase [Cyclobacteriaceae bacterium]